MNFTTQKGLMTELDCQKDFTRYGILLSQPIVADSRYDFLADIDGKIYKIQCKSCHSVDEQESAIIFPVASKNWNKGTYKDYHNQIDFFYTSFKEQGYLIPIEEVKFKSKVLRFFTDVSNAANPQIAWASDFEFEKQLKNIGYTVPAYENLFHKADSTYCADCGKEISKNAKYCRTCIIKHKKYTTKVTRPSREELKNMIRAKPFTQIGKEFNISDNGIRKWCDSYNLPRREKDIKTYTDEEWTKV